MAEIAAEGGVVVANDQRAADAGARMLADGGNAIDAIVATAFATGVTEPFLSGIGGGAWIVGRFGPTGERFLVDGGIAAPSASGPDMFAADPASPPGGLYGWPRVVNDDNIIGLRSIGVPGAVAALCLLHERLGRLDLATVMEPAIRLADDGHEVDWLASALITASATEIAQYPSTAQIFLPGGLPPAGPVMGPGHWLVQTRLARTLEAIAAGGPDAFYRGSIASALGASVRSEGGLLSHEDLNAYQATWGSPARAAVGNSELFGPLYTGFPTMVEMLQLKRQHDSNESGSEAMAWAWAMSQAFEDRFSLMSTSPVVGTPWERLMSADGAADAYASRSPAMGGEVARTRSGCTSHMTVVDRDGTIVALTQTVLDLFGSRYLEPETGVLLNDGMMYFDPRPSRINSVGPGLRGLSAVCPTIIERSGSPVAAVGASGGRRIISAVAQIVDRLLRGESISDAFAAPRLHVESGNAWLDPGWGAVEADRMRAAGLNAVVVAETPTTFNYARANGIARGEGHSEWIGTADATKPTGLAGIES